MFHHVLPNTPYVGSLMVRTCQASWPSAHSRAQGCWSQARLCHFASSSSAVEAACPPRVWTTDQGTRAGSYIIPGSGRAVTQPRGDGSLLCDCD